MSESKATPRPWKRHASLIYAPGDAGGNICAMSELRKSRFLQYDKLEIGSDDWDEQMANAQLIVTAVNAHDDLLAACKAAYLLLRKLGGKNHDPELTELAEAIDKAERETI